MIVFIRVRTRVDMYQYGRKSTTCFSIFFRGCKLLKSFHFKFECKDRQKHTILE